MLFIILISLFKIHSCGTDNITIWWFSVTCRVDHMMFEVDPLLFEWLRINKWSKCLVRFTDWSARLQWHVLRSVSDTWRLADFATNWADVYSTERRRLSTTLQRIWHTWQQRLHRSCHQKCISWIPVWSRLRLDSDWTAMSCDYCSAIVISLWCISTFSMQ